MSVSNVLSLTSAASIFKFLYKRQKTLRYFVCIFPIDKTLFYVVNQQCKIKRAYFIGCIKFNIMLLGNFFKIKKQLL